MFRKLGFVVAALLVSTTLASAQERKNLQIFNSVNVNGVVETLCPGFGI